MAGAPVLSVSKSRTRAIIACQMPAPDPSRILDTLTAYWQTDALKAGIDIGLFTALGRRARTPRQLASECGAGETGLRSLCDVLVALDFLHKREGRYRST